MRGRWRLLAALGWLVWKLLALFGSRYARKKVQKHEQEASGNAITRSAGRIRTKTRS